MEKSCDDLREKNNNLLIQKDLSENEIRNLKNLIENEKSQNTTLTCRLEEMEFNLKQSRDKESFNFNEISKLKSILIQLEKEKANLELQLKNIEQNINQNDILLGESQQLASSNSSDLVNEILKKFNDERKARQIAEDKSLDLDRSIKILNSDLKYLKEDLSKKEKEFNDEVARLLEIKKELEVDLSKKNQEINDLNTEISNFKIKEKHLNKICLDLKEENSNLKDEFDKLRKISLDAENTKIKKLQEEIDELKTMNQLYRSQRLESDEEISNHIRDKERLNGELKPLKREL